jgi:DNA-binding beta-propeller fold protein YncE
LTFAAAFSLASAGAPVFAQQSAGYRIVQRFTIGGEGGWDYVIPDTASNRLFVGRQNRVMVIDESTGKLLGEIAGLSAAHGVALDYTTGHGFATSGRDSTVVMFDLRSLNVLGRATAADDADAILYDPASKLVFTFNGDANSSSVIDPASGKRVGTIPLGGKPEYGVSAGDGKIYANIEDKSEVVEIDARAQRVTRRWSLAPCQSPTGLAIDVAHGRLFSGCGNRLMAISDATTGRLVKTLPIGAGVDATAYDAGTQNAFASNGDGTLTVIHEDSPSAFRVVETVQTMRGARTMALDPRSHRVYVVSAQFGPTPATATADNPRRRPPIVPGSFTVLELSR